MRRLPFLAAAFLLAAALVTFSADLTAQVVPKVDPKKVDPKADPKAKPGDPKAIPNAKVDPKADPKAKIDPKVDPKKADAKADPKAKAEPKKAEPKKTAAAKKDDDTPVVPPVDDTPLDTPNPLDLVRGLREKNLPDLALAYLDEIQKRKLPLGSLDQAALPLERARCLLELADDEADDGQKSAHLAEAKDGFTSFLQTNATHPRAAEAQVSLARLLSREARVQLALAFRLEDPAGRQAEAAKAQPLFEVAAKRFAAASKLLESQINTGKLDPRGKRRLEAERVRAKLDSGINQYEMRRAYIGGTAADVKRSDALKEAQDTFGSLGNVPKYDPLYWVSRAWVAECDYEAGEVLSAKEEFAYILRATANPAAANGIRLVKLFELRREYDAADNTLKLGAVEKSCRDWLKAYDAGGRPTPEAFEVRYLLGLTLHREAQAAITVPKGKGPVIPPAARKQLEEAERAFRVLASADTDFTDKAAKRRTQVVRVLLGEADRPPADYPTFEQCQMAALVQMAKIAEPPAEGQSDEDKRKDSARRRGMAIALLERAGDVATERDPPADVLNSQLQLVYMYQAAGLSDQAAVLGEYLARSARGNAAKNALAGAMAVMNYSAPAGKVDAALLDDVRKTDRARAIHLATFLDASFPNDPPTDMVRHRMADLLVEDQKLTEAYDVLLKVRAGYSKLPAARLTQGLVAFQLLTLKDSPLATPAKRKEVYDRTLADLKRVPNPGENAKADDAKVFLLVRSRVALFELIRQLANPAAPFPGYADAEAVAVDMLAEVPKFTALDDAAKLEYTLLADDLRVRAVYLQARELEAKKDYDALFLKIGPTVGPLAESGPAAKDGLEGKAAAYARSLDKNRQDLIVMALRGRIREGKIEEGGQLLDLLKKFGGTVDAMTATLQQLAGEMRGQIAALKKTGKPEDAADATKLTEGFAALMAKLAQEPGLKPDMQIFIGYSLQAVDQFDRSAENLRKVYDLLKEDEYALLFKPPADLSPEQQAATRVHRRAALYLTQSLRKGAKYDDALALVTKILGTKEKPGWGANSIDFRREANLLAEARAAAAKDDPKTAKEQWALALQGWAGLAAQQANLIRNKPMKPKIGPDGKPETGPDGKPVMVEDGQRLSQAKAAYFDFYFENQRCVLRANMQLLKDPAKVQEKLEAEARKMVDLETKNPDLSQEVRVRYADLLDEITLNDVPQLRDAYMQAGRANLDGVRPLKEAYDKAQGKMFMTRDPAPAPPADPKTAGGM